MDNKIEDKIKNIKAIAFDVDGVLFTGRVFVGQDGEIMKERSHIDGHGIHLLREIGMKIAFVTAEKSNFSKIVTEKLNSREGLEKIDLFIGKEGKNKVEVIDNWLKNQRIKWEECAAMGDDLIDYQLLQKSGFAVAPAQAEEVVKKIADYITERKGGDGAIRDFCNLILRTKGIDPTTL